ncbi:hypothetical protein LLG95_04790 [bacterium]|nr:hypothetical protein [bacterium]
MKNARSNTLKILQITLGALWLACWFASAAMAQTSFGLREPLRLDDGAAPVQDIHIAAQSRDVISIAWIAGEGPGARINLRHRVGSAIGIWDPIQTLQKNIGGQPRDLTLTHDAFGHVHLVWTAIESGRRQLHYANAQTPYVTPSVVPLRIGGSGEDEFPSIADVPGLGVVVVWEAETTTSTTIRAMTLPNGKPPLDLGVVSGASRSAIAPQIVSTNPLRVAWYEIDAIGGRLAINEWSARTGRWVAASIQPLAGALPQSGYVVLRADAGALAAGWQDVDGAGVGKIALDVRSRTAASTETTTRHWLFDTPSGEHTQPALDGSPLRRLVVAWRNFTTAGQQICIRSIGADGALSKNYVLSPSSQRFAGRVDQVTVGDWSMAAWTDVDRDGGGGGVYVSELNWPNLTK